ncbi:MAG: recombination protein O N-terminal domain-containing protein [Firmicutes bacterium]|nr:recombination protein O N-terminal domain-containing protein [Bacillota bacterium]
MSKDGIKVKALVLDAAESGEHDKTAMLYTAELGKLRAKFRGVRKAGAKFAPYAQVFAFNEYILSERGGNYVVTGCTAIEPFYGLAENEGKYFCAAFILGALNCAAPELEPDGRLFLSAVKAMAALETSQTGILGIAAKFLADTLACSGIVLDIPYASPMTQRTVAALPAAGYERLPGCSKAVGRAAFKCLCAVFSDNFYPLAESSVKLLLAAEV